jgi:hypothetical protein
MVALNRLLPAAIVVFGLLWGPSHQSRAQEPMAKGRLPPYFADIVTDEQRQQIYALQEKYARTLTSLQEQIAKLEKQRDAEIEAVLDAEQKKELKLSRERAAAKRKKAATDRKTSKAGG